MCAPSLNEGIMIERSRAIDERHHRSDPWSMSGTSDLTTALQLYLLSREHRLCRDSVWSNAFWKLWMSLIRSRVLCVNGIKMDTRPTSSGLEEPPMTAAFSETFLAESVALLGALDAKRSRQWPSVFRTSEHRWTAVHSWRRRIRGTCLPRGERLQQDLRLRSVRAHRQRVGAHRTDERRRVGLHIRRVAAGSRLALESTGSSSSR